MATVNLGRIGFVNKGAYNGATAYKINDVVNYNNSVYASIQAGTGQIPTDTAYWKLWIDSALLAPLASPALTGTPTVNGVAFSGYSGFKNRIINGGFGISQRGSSFTAGGYGLDRWYTNQVGGVVNVAQTYVGNNSSWLGAKHVWQGTPQTGVTAWNVLQRVEGVETLNGKSVTVSFVAAVSTGTMSLDNSRIAQNFGTGGSISVNIAFPNTITLNTTPTRYTATVYLPSINGKTVGASSYLELIFQSNVVTTAQTLYISQVQLEEGSVATPFEQRPYGLELSLCQRYYEILGIGYGNVHASSPTIMICSFSMKPKRVVPSLSLTTTTPYGESPINVMARTGSGSTIATEMNVSQIYDGSILIGITGFPTMTTESSASINGRQVIASAEL